jgi:hypothetical protein
MNRILPGLTVGGFPVGFVYVLQTTTHQKIGKSVNVDGVIAQAKRFDAGVRLLTCWPLPDYEAAETTIHEGLKQWRLNGEQFQIPTEKLNWICSLCDREFGCWLTETNCDARAIGWEFPRVYTPQNKRAWRVSYYSENDRVDWAMIVSECNPDYGTRESLFRQSSKAFNSAWLGTPRKYAAQTQL